MVIQLNTIFFFYYEISRVYKILNFLFFLELFCWAWSFLTLVGVWFVVLSHALHWLKNSVPAGVTLERLTEGLSPRHCALSLVGEPIMYPEINKLVDELHQRRISTFLVTNAQFPEKIKMLKPVTQV